MSPATATDKRPGLEVLGACLRVHRVQLAPSAMCSYVRFFTQAGHKLELRELLALPFFPPSPPSPCMVHVDVLRRPACDRQRLRTGGALASAGVDDYLA